MRRNIVVCIAEGWDVPSGLILPDGLPIKGELYTTVGRTSPEHLILKEFDTPMADGKPHSWGTDGFRPVDYSKGEKIAEALEVVIDYEEYKEKMYRNLPDFLKPF